MDRAKYLDSLFSLEGKVVLVTGAAGGIGKVLAEGYAKAGASVVLADLALERATEIAGSLVDAGCQAKAVELNVLDRDSIDTCVETVVQDFGRIDVLVNCAGINKREGFLDVTEEMYDRIMGINLKGVFFISQAVAKVMYRQKSGAVINIASYNAVSMLGGCAVYGASKGGIAALTRSMAVEWAQYGIRANAISPGHILTELSKVNWEIPERGDFLRERIAMRRPGLPEELIGIAILLASDASSYMSGMLIHVDGGCLAGGSPWPYDTEYERTVFSEYDPKD